MYLPNSVAQAKPNFSPPPTSTPNYGENFAFSNPVMTSNNIKNEHHMLGEYIFSLYCICIYYKMPCLPVCEICDECLCVEYEIREACIYE